MSDTATKGGKRREDSMGRTKNVRQLQPPIIGSANTSEPSTSTGSNDFGLESYTTASSNTDFSVNLNAKNPISMNISDTPLSNASEHSIVSNFEHDRTSTKDDIDECAIEEDKDNDWEDVEEGDSCGVADCPLFQRVDPKSNLTSRRSLLTFALREQNYEPVSQNAQSRSSSATSRSRTLTPNDPSTGNSPQEDSGRMMIQSQASHPKPIIMTTSNVHPPAMSPKTTRRNMLTSELTGSLRQNLLWERQQKNATTNAVAKRQQSAANLPALRRAMTTGDVKGLNNNTNEQQQAAKSGAFKDDSKARSTYNQFFNSGLNEYHESGW